jgi:D-lyxose ketol-isomerase
MKRSTINRAIEHALEFFQTIPFPLPPFAHWDCHTWSQKSTECDEIRNARLGWDITDFGSGRFYELGRVIVTLRNGIPYKTGKNYAQKVMMLLENQKSPIHFHKTKTEDIINHYGGTIQLCAWKANPDHSRSIDSFTLQIDGVTHTINPGEPLVLTPGESICLPPYTFHQFWAEKASGITCSVEISSTCDDYHDNIWLEPSTRFPEIEEDEAITYPILSDICRIG